MRKSKLKRTMSVLLTVLMVFMSMNFSVFAEELTAPADETTNVVEAPAEQSADEPAPAVVAPTPVDEETGTTEENATDNSLRQERPALLQAPVPNGTGIAKIDDQEYTDQATFLTAFNAMTGSHTVQLLADIDLGNIETDTAEGHAEKNDLFTVQKDADIILDLNGHKISAVFSSNRENSTSEYIIGNNGKLTIKDGSPEKSGAIENTCSNAYSCLGTVSNRKDASLTLESGTIASVTGNAIINYGTTTIHGGTIKTTGENYGGNENGAAAIHNRGSLDISKQEGNETPVLVSTNKAIPIWVSDNYITGSATISYGEFNTAQEKVDLKIESGHLKASITVTGGVWDKDPTAYVKPGYDIEMTEGKYAVKEGVGSTTKDVSSLNELETALNSVTDHWSYINITEDININKNLTIPEKAYITINSGKKLSVSNDSKIDLVGYLENKGTLDINKIGSGWINDITHLKEYGEISGLPSATNNVYKIATINQLQFLQLVMTSSESAFTGMIELQNDIDAAGYRFTAMGNDTNVFSGVFDGQTYAIKNLAINTVNGSGSLFNRAKDASFVNLNILDCNVNTTNGRLGLLAASTESSMSVKNIKVTGTMTAQTSYYCGGLIGYLGTGEYIFDNCDLSINVDGGNGYNVGTFWGSATGANTNTTIVNSKNTGNISGAGSLGIVGGFGYGSATQVKLFGYEYTGTVTQKGQGITNPPYCVNVAKDSFTVCQARIAQPDNSYTYYPTIEEAVANAADNAVIEIAPGTYNLSSTLRVNKPLTLKGLGDVIITRGDAWTPEDEQATDSETGSLILIEKTNDVTLENLTIQGARKITGSVTANGHGINIVQSTGVALNNVTSKDNAAAGIVVNGSTVTAGGLYTSGNGWYGVNVDQGSGITDDTSFTLDTAQPYKLSERLQIVSDKFATSENIYVNADGFAQRSYMDGEHEVVYWVDEASLIKNTTKNITYTTIKEAIDGATRGNTIEIPAGIYSDTLDINKSGLTLKKAAGDGDCVLDGAITISSKNVNIQDIKAGDNAKVAVKKDASLILKNATGFDTDKKITVEKLFGEAYDTGMVKLDGTDVAKDKLGFTYLGEEIKSDINLFKANEVSYTVKTPAQFYWLSQQINEGKINTSNVTIKLGNDLDFHNDEWMPVGVANHDYIGKFDGQSHKISNLLVNMPGKKYIGLFGKAWGAKELGNVDFENVNIIGGQYAGTLAGQLGSATVKNVNVNNFVFKTGEFTGGIVGSGYSNISNCKVQSGSIATEDQNVGGILGFLGEGNFTIQNCHSDQITISEPSWDAGGLIGATVYGNVKVYNCSVKNSTITITASGWFESYGSYRGELIGEMRGSKTYEANLYLYNCNSVDTTAINKNVPGDQSQLVGGNQDYIKTLTVYNVNNQTPYATISEAVEKATAGDTITIGAGTYDETVTLDKAVNLVGPYAKTDIKAADVTAENRPEATEAVITGGINITRTTQDANSISIKGLKFTRSGIYSVGWGNDPNLDSITIENNVFENIANELNNREKSVSAIHFNLADSQPVQNCTIKNNRISGVANGDSSGINVFVVSGETNITGNYVENTNHGSLQIQGSATGSVTIVDNTFKNWDQDVTGGGRAMRFGDFSGVESLTVTGNKMIRTLELGEDKDEMAKFTKVPESSETIFNLSLNYWNGKLPVTTYGAAVNGSVIVAEAGTAKINAVPYYTDEAMTTIRVPATVYGTDGQEKGQYLTIQEAVNAAKTGETVQLADGVYTETVTLKDQVTLKGADSGNTVIQCTIEPITSPNGNGENAAVLLMKNNITAKVENVAFDITKTGQSPISFNTTGILTIEGCRFTGTEGAEYGTNAIYGGGNKDATVIFKDNTFEVPYRMAITSLGKDSVVTGNTFNIGTNKVGENQRTSVLTVVAQEGTINISNNIFVGANRAIGVDHSSLSANKLTIKNNQFIDVRYGFELGSEKNKTCGTYDLSKNYYAKTNAEGTETVSAMLVEDADESGSHFDDTSLYTGNQVKVYPYYKAKTMTENDLYAPVELVRSNATVGYFGTITDAFRAADNDDTVVVNQTAEGTAATIAGDIDMNVVKDGKVITVNLQLEGSTTFTGNITGTTKGHLILNTAKDATEATTVIFDGKVDGFVSVDTINFDAAKAPVIKAGKAQTDNNSFISKTGVLVIAEEGDYRTWTYTSPSDHFNGGNGTQAKPYQINTADQLKLLAKGNTKDMYYKLTNDITVSDWEAVNFEGSFDGDGYTITGDGTTAALFGKIGSDAVIEKLIVKGSFLQMAAENAGTVRNSAAIFTNIQTSTLAGTNTGTIENSFTNSTKGLTDNGAEGGTITNSFYTGDMTNLTAHTYTKEDMQKARFAIKLNGKQPFDQDVNGIWGYNIEAAAYPVINKDGAANIVALEEEITVNSSDANVGTATLSHEGLTHIYANDSVTLTAKVTNPSYAFNGWYLGDTKDIANRFSREIEASYQVTGAATITAQFNALPTRKVSALTFHFDRGTVQVGTGVIGNASEQDVIYGQTVTIKAAAKAGYKFAYWTTLSDYIANPASPAVANTNAEWTLPLSTESVNYVAMFEPATSHRIIFQNSNGTILANITVEDGKAAPENTRPGNPTMPQKIFTGWTLNNGKDILTNEQVDEKLKTVSADMTFTAVYEDDPAAAEYTITVNGGTIQGESTTTVKKKYNQSITVIATPQTGKNFAGWHKNAVDGPIVSYDETYNFIVSDTVTLYAVYEDQPVEKLPTVNLDPNVTQVDQGVGYPDLYKLRFVAQVNLPDGYTKSACGLVYKKEAVQNPSELTLENVDGTIIKKTTSTTQSATGQWATNFAKLTDNATVCVKAYLTYTNQYGETYTVYSDMVTGTVKAPTQQ